MKQLLIGRWEKHSKFWTKDIGIHLVLSLILFGLSVLLTYFASTYVHEYTGYVVPDLLLDTLPVVNVSFIFFQGAFIFVLVLLLILFLEPKFILFVVESSALFFLIRSFFMVLTHLSAPSVEYYTYIQKEHHIREALFTISSGNDLFFSGHVGYPFLLALIFWKYKPLRALFIFCSLGGAVVVILGHLHYSIDVFSAFFITYGVFEISKYLFKKEYELIHS